MLQLMIFLLSQSNFYDVHNIDDPIMPLSTGKCPHIRCPSTKDCMRWLSYSWCKEVIRCGNKLSLIRDNQFGNR